MSPRWDRGDRARGPCTGGCSLDPRPMEFRLLGPLEVVDGATSLPIAARKQRALLAVLLLDANRTVSRERIVDDLWGDAVPDSARKMVQTYVSQLRRVLPEPRLHTRPPGYALELEADELDLDRFERLVADGRAALSGGRPGDAADVIQCALALWRGPALAEFSEPFARHEAARLEELRLTALEWRIEADLAVGRDADVVGELEALVPNHPLRERLRSQQMLALYRAGHPAEALASYESFRRELADQRGNEPSPALKDLERRMLVQDPRLERPSTGPEAVAPPAVLPVAPRASRTALVGREAELAGVREFLSAGEPTALVLVGGPGIGKTTLWEAGVDAAREHGLRVLAARPTDAEARHSFATLIDLSTESLQRTRRPPGPPAHALEVALLRGAAGPPPPGHAISVGFLGALRTLAAGEPVLVAIDDIQWLDPASVDSLVYAAHRLEGVGSASCSPSDPDARRASSGRWSREGWHLDVGPLSLGAMRRLLVERLDLGLPRHALQRIFESTLGNPLFALELGRTLAAGGRSIDEDIPVPDAVEDLLGPRVRASTPGPEAAPRRRADGDLRVSQLAAITEPTRSTMRLTPVCWSSTATGCARRTHVAAAAASRSRAADRRLLHRELAGSMTRSCVHFTWPSRRSVRTPSSRPGGCGCRRVRARPARGRRARRARTAPDPARVGSAERPRARARQVPGGSR